MCEKAVLQGLASIKAHVKTLKELNLSFVPVEERCFSLDLPNALADLYGPTAHPDLRGIANRIASVCAALGENPIVRHSIMYVKRWG